MEATRLFKLACNHLKNYSVLMHFCLNPFYTGAISWAIVIHFIHPSVVFELHQQGSRDIFLYFCITSLPFLCSKGGKPNGASIAEQDQLTLDKSSCHSVDFFILWQHKKIKKIETNKMEKKSPLTTVLDCRKRLLVQ